MYIVVIIQMAFSFICYFNVIRIIMSKWPLFLTNPTEGMHYHLGPNFEESRLLKKFVK